METTRDWLNDVFVRAMNCLVNAGCPMDSEDHAKAFVADAFRTGSVHEWRNCGRKTEAWFREWCGLNECERIAQAVEFLEARGFKIIPPNAPA